LRALIDNFLLSSLSIRIFSIASAVASGFPGGTTKPVSPSLTTSGRPPTFETTTGTPHASASTTATPNDSLSDTDTDTVKAFRYFGPPGVVYNPRTLPYGKFLGIA